MQIHYRTKRINYDHNPRYKGVADIIEVEYQVNDNGIEKIALDSELIFEDRIHISVLSDAYRKYTKLFTNPDTHDYEHITDLDNEWEAVIRFLDTEEYYV